MHMNLAQAHSFKSIFWTLTLRVQRIQMNYSMSSTSCVFRSCKNIIDINSILSSSTSQATPQRKERRRKRRTPASENSNDGSEPGNVWSKSIFCNIWNVEVNSLVRVLVLQSFDASTKANWLYIIKYSLSDLQFWVTYPCACVHSLGPWLHYLFVGCQLCWKDHLVFICHAVCMYVQIYVYTDVGFSSTSKSKPSLSNVNAMTDFCQTWYVGGDGHKYYPCGLSSPNAHIWYLICISVLIS